MVGLDEMLGRVDLHRTGQHQGGPDRVGADVAFAPVGADCEPQPLGVLLDLLRTVPPQDHSAGVDHHHHMTGVLGSREQDVAEHGQHLGEFAAVPAVLDLVGADRGRQVAAPIRIHAEFDGPPPGCVDNRTRGGRRPLAGQGGIADLTEQMGVPDRILAGGHRRFEGPALRPAEWRLFSSAFRPATVRPLDAGHHCWS